MDLVQGELIKRNYIEQRRSHCPFHGSGFDRRMRSHDQQPWNKQFPNSRITLPYHRFISLNFNRVK